MSSYESKFGVDTFKIDTVNNRVGIGTYSPQAILHVVLPGRGDAIQIGVDGNNNNIATIGVNTGGLAYFGRGGEHLLISSGGNIGIGVSPSQPLDVVGHAFVGTLKIGGLQGGGNTAGMELDVEGDCYFRGTVGVGTSPLAKFHIKGTGTTSASNAMYVTNADGGSGEIALFKDSREARFFGNVGVGTHDPGATTFQVRADNAASIAYFRNDSSATSQRVLTLAAYNTSSDSVELLQCESAAGDVFKVTAAGSIVMSSNSTVNHSRFYSNGEIQFTRTNWTNNSGVDLGIDGSGLLTITISSERYKENVEDLHSIDTSKIYDLRAVEFDLKSSGEHGFGYIAEEVDEILPELVYKMEDEDGTMVPETVHYKYFGVLAIEELKKLKDEKDKQIKALQARCRKLEKALEDLTP